MFGTKCKSWFTPHIHFTTNYISLHIIGASFQPILTWIFGLSGFLTPLRCSVTFPPWYSEIIPPDICLIKLSTSGNPAICWSVHRLSPPHLTVRLVALVWQMDAGQLFHLLFLSGVAQTKGCPRLHRCCAILTQFLACNLTLAQNLKVRTNFFFSTKKSVINRWLTIME